MSNYSYKEDREKELAIIHERLSQKLNSSLRKNISPASFVTTKITKVSPSINNFEKKVVSVGGEVRKKGEEITKKIERIESLKKKDGERAALLHHELILAEKYIAKKNAQILELKSQLELLRFASKAQQVRKTETSNIPSIKNKLFKVEESVAEIKKNTSLIVASFEKDLRNSKKGILEDINFLQNKKLNENKKEKFVKDLKNKIRSERDLAETEWRDIRHNFPIYLKKRLYKLVKDYDSIEKRLNKLTAKKAPSKKGTSPTARQNSSDIEVKIKHLEDSLDGLVSMLDSKKLDDTKKRTRQKVGKVYEELSSVYSKTKDQLDDKNALNKWRRVVLAAMDNMDNIKSEANKEDSVKIENINQSLAKIKDKKIDEYTKSQKEIELTLEGIKNF